MARQDIVAKWNEIWMGLPRELALRAAPIVDAGVQRAYTRVHSAYPRITGELQDGLKIDRTRSSDPAIVSSRLKSTAPHAKHYEFGTRRQKARPTFLPITREEKRATTMAVIRMVEASGVKVTGGNQ